MSVTIYPTGVTIYNPEKCFNGYTIYQAPERGAMLIDMNGYEHKLWENLQGFPNKILPGGFIMGSRGERNPKFGKQDQIDLVQVDWDGNIVWKFNELEYIDDPGEEAQWMARQHHDYQREGNPVGYYVPNMEMKTNGGNTLILAHKNLYNKNISEKYLCDDYIVEVDWEGDIIWEWSLSDHFDEIGLREASKNTLYRHPNTVSKTDNFETAGDWAHVNSMSYLGPNKWYDKGDERFNPENIIIDCRDLNFSAIISKETGDFVWKLGPYYDTPELKHLGWIIGQHHVHMIPRGLPGEGNILIFDNGGWAGYDSPNPGAPTGFNAALRDYSRVLEIDPRNYQIVWQYTPKEAGFTIPLDAQRFYSGFISGMQRLPNGNTLICEGSNGRVFEVTSEHEIVWEFVNPYKNTKINMNNVYRAYRVPYEWIPQTTHKPEIEIAPVDLQNFRLPNAAASGVVSSVKIEGTMESFAMSTVCVASDVED